MGRAALTATMYALVALAACAAPPRSHALTVRHPERKCALVRFSFCALIAPDARAASAHDEDAGVDM